MGQNVNVAILRARHDRSVDLISDEACERAIFTNSAASSVFQYWTSVTGGHYTFHGSRMFAWTDIELDGSVEEQRGRDHVYRLARDAAANAEGFDPGEFDRVLVIALPGMVEFTDEDGNPVTEKLSYGAGEEDGVPYCVMRGLGNVQRDYCHELAHTMGWGHPYGVLNNGIEWDGKPPYSVSTVYGDPFDVMSSATFGTRSYGPVQYSGSPSFAADPVPDPGWPSDNLFWQGLGPMPSQAHLHLQLPGVLDAQDRVVTARLPGPGQVVRQQLFAASDAPAGQPTLLALRHPAEPADGAGRWYLEYRRNTGWDAGLDDAGPDLARRAVVLHRLERVPDAGVRPWYRGRILVPVEVDADVRLRGTPITARVVAVAPDDSYVSVSVQQTDERVVLVDRRDTEDVESFTPQRTDTADTICGSINATWGVRRVSTEAAFTARAYGFGGTGGPTAVPPALSWTVAGLDVTGSSDLAVTAEPGRTVLLIAVIDGDTLTLTSRPDDGAYELHIVATVRESDGSASASSDPQPFTADGLRPGYERSIQQQLDSCIRDILNKARIRPQDIFVPPWGVRTQAQIDKLVAERLGLVVKRLIATHPQLAADLQHVAMLRYAGWR